MTQILSLEECLCIIKTNIDNVQTSIDHDRLEMPVGARPRSKWKERFNFL